MRATEEELKQAVQLAIQELKVARDALFFTKQEAPSNRANRVCNELRELLSKK